MTQKKLSPIETAVLSLSILFLSVSLWEIVQITLPPRRDFFILSYAIIIICLIFLTFTRKPALYAVTSLIHILFTFSIIISLNDRFKVLEIVLMLTVILNFILRMTPRISLPLILIVILTQLISYFVSLNFNYSLQFAKFHGREIAYSILIEVAFASLFQTLVFYREKLVSTNNALNQTRDSLKNLEAATNSFVIHLTELREESAEQERNRITRELHDSLGYAMTNIVMMMNATAYLQKDDRDKLSEYCRMTKNLASTTMDETRNTLYRLRKIGRGTRLNALENLNRLCKDFQKSTGVTTEFEPGNLPSHINDNIYQVIFRAIQVGFINALKHSYSDYIKISFCLSQEELTLIIWNRTIKEESPDHETREDEGIGLTGIRERLSEIDGHLIKRPGKHSYELIISIPADALRGNSYE